MEKKDGRLLLKLQRNEFTAHHIYLKLAKSLKDRHNKDVLEEIARDELKHYYFWKAYTGKDVKPKFLMISFYFLISKLFGLSFALKLREKSEFHAYSHLLSRFPQLSSMIKDEQKHEKVLLSMLDEDIIKYASSIVLGLNDALVELTGALAGLTLALQNSNLVAIAGLITGVAASLSMAASGYLSSKEEVNHDKKPLTSAFYTGITYLFTVFLLVLPYFFFRNVYAALALMLLIAILIIFTYTFYITTAKSLPFWRRFIEMAILSLSVACISFGIGLLIRAVWGVEV